MSANASDREEMSISEFAELLALSVTRQIIERKNDTPTCELRALATGLNPAAPEQVIDIETLFLLNFILMQQLSLVIREENLLDRIFDKFYEAIVKSMSYDPPSFERWAKARWLEYLVPWNSDMKLIDKHTPRNPPALFPYKHLLIRFAQYFLDDFTENMLVGKMALFLEASCSVVAYYASCAEMLLKLLKQVKLVQ